MREIKEGKRGLTRTVAIIIVVVVIIVAVAGGYTYYYYVSSTTVQLTTVNITSLPGYTPFSPWVVAQQQGYFEKLGLKAVITSYQSDSAGITALASGQADIDAGTQLYTFAEAVQGGAPIKCVASALNGQEEGWDILVLTNSTITSVSQLNGKNVGVSAVGSATDMYAKAVMKTYNITFTEVSLGITARANALLAGQVDAIVSTEPQTTTLIAKNQARMLVDLSATLGKTLANPAICILTTNSMIANHPDVIRKSLQAYFAAVRYMQNNPSYSYTFLQNYTALPQNIVQSLFQDAIVPLSTNGQVNQSAFAQSLQLQYQFTGKATLPQVSDILDTQFVPIQIPSNLS